MHKRTFTLPLLFLSFIITINTYAMKRAYKVLAQDNEMCLFMQMPFELQQKIFYPAITVKEIGEDNADEVNESLKSFFMCKQICKHFNTELKLPWLQFSIEEKNSMMQEVIVLMEKKSYESYVDKDRNELYQRKHSNLVSYGYKKYCIIALALVDSGANPDIMPNDRVDLLKSIYLLSETYAKHKCKSIDSSTCLSKAVHAQDIRAIRMLLDKNANPYQLSFDEDVVARDRAEGMCGCQSKICYYSWSGPVCFSARTEEIIKLFLERIDKQKLLDTRWPSLLDELMYDFYSPEIMKCWLEYGIKIEYQGNLDIPFGLFDGLCNSPSVTLDNFLQKVESLLQIDPDTVNAVLTHRWFSYKKITPLDMVDLCCSKPNHRCKVTSGAEQIRALLRKYGCKTAQELEDEQIQ